MADPLKKILEPIEELQIIRGVKFPVGVEFLQLIVTGPPGAGKSHFIEQIRGWPNEGYLDLTHKGWWKDQTLLYRPREIHLGLPFRDFQDALTVFEKEWLETSPPPRLELIRIQIPPEKELLFRSNWKHRYIFEFLIPDAGTILGQRQKRRSEGYFPVDENLSLEMVKQQSAVYREVALYLHRAGLNVYMRKGLKNPPLRIAEKGITSVPVWSVNKSHARPSLKSLAGWKWFFLRRYPTRWLTITHKEQEIKTACRIAHDGKSFELILSSTRLRFHPEIPLGVKKRISGKTGLSIQSRPVRQNRSTVLQEYVPEKPL